MKTSYNIGLVRVVSFDDKDLLDLHGQLIEKYYPMLKVISKSIPDQPNGIHNEETEKIAVPKIIELAKGWKDIDALIISCAGDPAVKELRGVLDIPVIGAGMHDIQLLKEIEPIVKKDIVKYL
mgnify:CR=1 FL=1